MYNSILNERETEQAIKFVKDVFQQQLAGALNLRRVTAPLFVESGTGINDDLNGWEHPVSFEPKFNGKKYEIVHSLAKWKRMRLNDDAFKPGEGLYTDMNAIRPDEDPDFIHSIYVDQWDWEKIITKNDRNVIYLNCTVRDIYNALLVTERLVCDRYPEIKPFLPQSIFYINTSELAIQYPDLTPKEREHTIAKEVGAVFIEQIGGTIYNGERHDGRAADYDDWKLNGDIVVWCPWLNCSIELSSMGIRVDGKALITQLIDAGKEDWKTRKYHKMIMNNELPLTIGGGIGQSRLCMLLLHKAHIGEVQASVWPDSEIEKCKINNIKLL